MNDWAQIRQLSRGEGLSGREIAKRLGVARRTVAKALASDSPPVYKPRPPVVSSWSRVEPQVRALLAEFPEMASAVICERVGWQGSPAWFRQCVARIRPEYRRVDPADRLTHLPGEQVQCDLWFPSVDVPVGESRTARFPVLVMVSSFARFIAAVMIPSRLTWDLLAGMWLLLARDIGAVPRRLLWDNEAGIGRAGKLAAGVAGWCGVLGTRIKQARPYDPETKGVVERANQFLETSFLPGRVFVSPDDFNTQLSDWLAAHGNHRLVRATGRRPEDAIAEDRRSMIGLPPVAPSAGDPYRVRLGRDYYVRAASNDYSVDPAMIDRLVEVSISLGQIQVTYQHQLVASHLRCWDRGQVITDPAHVAQAARLRLAYQQPRPSPTGGLLRDLADYDKAFGVDPDQLAAYWTIPELEAV